MALARIITRSQECSRELALDLLARGYAVEIISPDSIPDNIADLELRVDTVLGNRLVASVEAHDGERSASLEFLHHLKAPMVDFIRRPPEPRESAHSPKEPVSFPPVPNIEAAELPPEAPQPAPKAVSPAADVLHSTELDREEGARPILPPQPLPSIAVEPPISFAVEASTIAQPTLVEPTPVQLEREPQPPDRRAGWIWRTALAFAIVVLLALVLGFGMRRAGKASTQNSEVSPEEKVAPPSTDVGLSSGATPERDPQEDPGQVSAVPVSPPAAPAIRSERNSNHAPEELPVAKPGASTPNAAATTSHRLSTDLIARDTVTYFDERASNETAPRAEPAKGLARQQQLSGKRDGGVISASTVTYFDKKPAPKATK